MGGFVMIDRDVQKAEWYKDTNATRLFLHLAFNAFFADGTIYKQGQCRFSVAELSNELSITSRQIGTAIKKLEKYGVISSQTEEKKSIGTLFTILKYVNFGKNEMSNTLLNEMSNGNSSKTINKQLFTKEEKQSMSNEMSNTLLNEMSNQYDNNINREKNINNTSSSRIGENQNFSSLIDVVEFVKMKKQPEALLQLSELMLIKQDELIKVLDEFAVANVDGEKRTLIVWGKYFQACKDSIIARIRNNNNQKPKQHNNGKSNNGYMGRGAYEPDPNKEYTGHFGD